MRQTVTTRDTRNSEQEKVNRGRRIKTCQTRDENKRDDPKQDRMTVLSDDQRRLKKEKSEKHRGKSMKNKGYGSNSRGGASKNTGNVSRNGREHRREAIITAKRLTAASLRQQTLFGHVEFVARSKKQLSPYPSSLRPRAGGQLIVPKKSAHRPKTHA